MMDDDDTRELLTALIIQNQRLYDMLAAIADVTVRVYNGEKIAPDFIDSIIDMHDKGAYLAPEVSYMPEEEE